MPIYEYEPTGHQCQLCSGRIEILQNIDEEPYTECPTCYLPVKRIVSRASFKTDKTPSAEKAAEKGFTTYKKVGKGQYEKIAGEGADAIIKKDSK